MILCSVHKNYQYELYKIGVWLKHPVNLTKDLITQKLNRLETDILDKDYVPKLGGSYQDKVCSAMLLNNEFISVQNQKTDRDKQFYPWMKTGSCKLFSDNDIVIEDYELSLRRYKPDRYRILYNEGNFDLSQFSEFQSARKSFDENYHPHQGYLKKYFHLWKGENIYHFDSSKSLDNNWENLSRFRFICINPENRNSKIIRNSGVIRLIEEPTHKISKAYEEWLSRWLKTKNGYQIILKVKGEKAARLIFDGKKIFYHNKAALLKLSSQEIEFYNSFEGQQTINLIHSSQENTSKMKNICKYRNHGIYIEYFCKRKEPQKAVFEEKGGLAAELLETLATNVCIFDNRIANRVQKADHETLRKALNCSIFPERTDLWDKEKAKGFSRYQFLVIHLSFIEAFREKGLKKYSEKEIGVFIEKEILQGNESLGNNFKLIITTGRGRTQWWTKLAETRNEYTSFTTFRPVESLIASVENSVSMQDDIELKYRLVKVLFGS